MVKVLCYVFASLLKLPKCLHNIGVELVSTDSLWSDTPVYAVTPAYLFFFFFSKLLFSPRLSLCHSI